MIPDLSPIFSRYESLRAEADALFARVRETQPGCVTCKEGCSDCCHAVFDLSLVEAMSLNRAFEAAFAHGPERSAILTRASETDRRLTRLKRELFRAEKDGESPEALMARTAIGGQGHVCGFSAFEKGKAYPTVHLDKIQARLDELSREVARTVESRFSELHEVYVPLSMALITRYDEAYLGIGKAKPEE